MHIENPGQFIQNNLFRHIEIYLGTFSGNTQSYSEILRDTKAY